MPTTPRSPSRRISRLRRARLHIVAPFVAALLSGVTACEDPTSYVVTRGTIDGVAFTVLSGRVEQINAGGAILGDAAGAVIALDASPGALGMSDPTRLHLRTEFALRHGGTITVGAFGTVAAPLGPGTAVVIGRNNTRFDYVFYVDSLVFADSSFTALPTGQESVENVVVTEFYAQDVPGYGAGSGVAMWPLNDSTPAQGEDVLGCTVGPAMSSATLSGDRVVYALGDAFILSIEVVDTIIGPCV